MAMRTSLGEGGARGNEPSVTEREVLEVLRAIRYGSIEITLHEGRIVQIERREKVRFRDDASSPRGRSAS
jgi:hypothetical protein